MSILFKNSLPLLKKGPENERTVLLIPLRTLSAYSFPSHSGAEPSISLRHVPRDPDQYAYEWEGNYPGHRPNSFPSIASTWPLKKAKAGRETRPTYCLLPWFKL
uniref:Uncharacterized protein n=1 Tax=Solanum lycopersicum TaxID=4081 RepID=A0A3Q7EEQ3_SOLLC